MKLKSILLTGLSFVLVTAVAIGGTLAYLTSTDDDVNVMTLGNVKIEQIELQRVQNDDGTYPIKTIGGRDSYMLEAFEQGKMLVPTTEIDDKGKPINYGAGNYQNTVVMFEELGSYNGMQVFKSENAVDKFVFVKNTGNTPAYVRTLIAFEMGSLSLDESKLMTRKSYHGAWNIKEAIEVTIDGKNYAVYEYVYQGFKGTHTDGVLPAGATTPCSLAQVYLNSAATNETVEKLDGNKNGTYDILVVSQAVQADGFADAETALDTAFGDITTTNHPWVNPVSSVDELEKAIANGDTTVILDNNIDLSEQLEVNGELTVLGNGHTITAPSNGTRVVNVMDNTEDVTVTLVGVKLDAADKERGISFYNNSGDLDVTIIDCEITAKYYGVNVAGQNAQATLNIKDSTLTGYCAFQTYSPNTVATFDNCVLEGVNLGYNNTQYPYSNNFATVVVNSLATNSTLTFNNCTVIATEKDSATAPAGQWPATQAHIIDKATGTTINWNNCTFIKNGVEVSAPESIN